MSRDLLDLAAAFVAAGGDAAGFVDEFQRRFREVQYADDDARQDDDPAWDPCCEINSTCDWYTPHPAIPPDLDDAALRLEVARHLQEFAAT